MKSRKANLLSPGEHFTSPDVKSFLPPLYSAWMNQLLEGPIPEETEADCRDCTMCAAQNGGHNKSEFLFNRKTKCCTYMPDLPNFLVGAVLQDESLEQAKGRAALEQQLSENLTVTPLGANPPAAYMAMYKENIGAFGQDVNLRCPLYLEEEGGLCGIWKHRNSRCATWFCKFVRGSVGVIFWKYVDQLLSALEGSLARWCVLQLDIGPAALEQLFPPPPTERVYSDLHQIWGRWSGMELEFYRECSKLIEPLSWQDVAEIGGAEIRIFARLTRQAYENLMSDKIPEIVRVSAWKKMIVTNAGHYRVWSYSSYDPIDVPRSIMDVLHYFDGRSTKDALRVIAQEKGVQIDGNYIRKLADFGLLVSS